MRHQRSSSESSQGALYDTDLLSLIAFLSEDEVKGFVLSSLFCKEVRNGIPYKFRNAIQPALIGQHGKHVLRLQSDADGDLGQFLFHAVTNKKDRRPGCPNPERSKPGIAPGRERCDSFSCFPSARYAGVSTQLALRLLFQFKLSDRRDAAGLEPVADRRDFNADRFRDGGLSAEVLDQVLCVHALILRRN